MQAICPAESAPNDGMMAKQPPFLRLRLAFSAEPCYHFPEAYAFERLLRRSSPAPAAGA